MSSRIYSVSLGSPAATASLVLLGAASAGTVGALGTLTHPDSANFPAITYETNPDRTLNLDNEVLIPQYSSTVLTLADRKLTQAQGNIADVLVTEIWLGGGNRAPMTTAFWRLLYEYYANPPAFSATSPVYIQWAPAYRSLKTYNVQIVDFVTGSAPGGDPSSKFDVSDQRVPGGVNQGGNTQHGVNAILATGIEAGLVDLDVVLQMKIVSEA